MSTALVWFRRDLRLDDNPALHAALKAGHRVVPVYIHAPAEERPWSPGAASGWWLHHSLAALNGDLVSRGSALAVRRGASIHELERLAASTGAEAVYWNRLYEPAAIERDTRVKAALRTRGLHVESHNGSLLIEPWQVETGQGDPYKVFTPFWKNARAKIDRPRPLAAPERLVAPPPVDSVSIDSLGLLPRIPWDAAFADHWRPGEAGARERLRDFIDQAVAGYRTERDVPAVDGTSRLSPHLHFGELSPGRVVERMLAHAECADGRAEGTEFYIRELGWREFAHHLLYHFPHTGDAPLNARFADFPWQQNPAALEAWQKGATGVPIVDAGMRQLWHAGWMHNRVRMIVASLLTKNLRIHWLEGARWFWDTLVDADLANNTQGWQWSAGSGADAAPYFRIFNPVAQGERFDPEGRYLSAWVPEVARVPLRWRHQPWAAPPGVLDESGLASDSVYRQPIVDLKESREAALAAYAAMRGST